jgi:hypothetical protein
VASFRERFQGSWVLSVLFVGASTQGRAEEHVRRARVGKSRVEDGPATDCLEGELRKLLIGHFRLVLEAV